jgi:multidrug resistance efflux pump
MLNISNNKLNKTVSIDQTVSGKKVFHKKDHKHFNRFLMIASIILIIVLFLPWTQNVRGRGNVTTLRLDQRPQTINSPIPGRIEKWYVREGDSVKKGDTIVFISEIKSEYFDPNLVERTEQQIQAKKSSVNSYENKVKTLGNQIAALQNERDLKIEQAQNKLRISKLEVTSDSIGLEAAETNLQIAQRQYDRTVDLLQDGFKAVKDVEEKKLKLQETQRKLVAQQNKLLASKNKVVNARIELNRVRAEYIDKISKAESDRFTAESNQFDTEAQVTKLENSKSNYAIRNNLYYITAPQSGYINKALRGGIGQTFKEGEALVGIMPTNIEMAVETFVEPIDLPLMHLGEKVQIQFDGWPAIVFSGWPNTSFGTFTGEVVAIENFISSNGKYRILIAPDPDAPEWPDALRAGAGAETFALLEDVPVWYELWRQLNGFPPNYYQPEGKTDSKDSKK